MRQLEAGERRRLEGAQHNFKLTYMPDMLLGRPPLREVMHTYERGFGVVEGEDRLGSRLPKYCNDIEIGSGYRIRLDRRTAGMTNGEPSPQASRVKTSGPYASRVSTVSSTVGPPNTCA